MLRSCIAFLCLLCALTCVPHSVQGEGSDISIYLAANWGETSLVAEASEFFADEGPQWFWRFVTEFLKTSESEQDDDVDAAEVDAAEVDVYANHRASYENILTLARAIGGEERENMLKLALDLRYYSPRIDLHRRTALELASTLNISEAVLNGECSDTLAFIRHTHSDTPELSVHAVACSVAQLRATLDRVPLSSGPLQRTRSPIDRFDHVFAAASASSPSSPHTEVLLYTRVGSQAFLDAHRLLEPLARQHTVRYSVRHHPSVARTGSDDAHGGINGVALPGWGAELDYKSMEYKAFDDSELDAEKEPEDADGGDDTDDESDVEGINFGVLSERHPKLSGSLTTLRDYLRSTGDQSRDLEDLKAWEVVNLGLQTSQRILSSSEPLRTLRDVAQNFPYMVVALSRLQVDKKVTKKINANQKHITPGLSITLVNGHWVDTASSLSPFSIFGSVKREVKLYDALASVHLSHRDIISLMGKRAKASQSGGGTSLRFDTRSEHTVWLNDLEEDKAYQDMPTSLKALFQPSYSRFFYVRKNLINVVLALNPSSIEGLEAVYGIVSLWKHQLPVRYGLLFDVLPDDEVGRELVACFLHLEKKFPHRGGISFLSTLYSLVAKLQDEGDVTAVTREMMETTLEMMKMKGITVEKALTAHGDDATALFTGSRATLQRLGLVGENDGDDSVLPKFFMNGVILDGTDPESVPSLVVGQVDAEYTLIKSAYKLKKLTDKTNDVYGFILSQKDVVSRYNPLIISPDVRLVPLAVPPAVGRVRDGGGMVVDSVGEEVFEPQQPFAELNRQERASRVMDRLAWFGAIWGADGGDATDDDDIKTVSHILCLDLADEAALFTLQGASLHVRSAAGKRARFAVVLAPAEASVTGVDVFSRAILAAGRSQTSDVANELVHTLIDLLFVDRESAPLVPPPLPAGLGDDPALDTPLQRAAHLTEEAVWQVIAHISDFQPEAFTNVFEHATMPGSLREEDQWFVSRFLRATTSHAVVTNGRLIEFGDSDGNIDFFTDGDFALLGSHELSQRGQSLDGVLHDITFDESVPPDDISPEFISTVGMKVISELANHHAKYTAGVVFQKIPKALSPSFIHDSTDEDGTGASRAKISFDVVLDPLSTAAQRFIPILLKMIRHVPSRVNVYLNPKQRLSSIPLKSFYRFVMDDLHFDSAEHGGWMQRSKTGAFFPSMPPSRLLTLKLDTPEAWLIGAVEAAHDLDNIRLNEVRGADGLVAHFQLEHILLEGACEDTTSRFSPPPVGLQLTLGSETKPHQSDTIVMSNREYFQLQSNPGVHLLGLADGRSNSLYRVVRATPLLGGQNALAEQSSGTVTTDEDEDGDEDGVDDFGRADGTGGADSVDGNGGTRVAVRGGEATADLSSALEDVALAVASTIRSTTSVTASAGTPESSDQLRYTAVAIADFDGLFVDLQVKKRAGMEDEDMYSEEVDSAGVEGADDDGGSVWNWLSSPENVDAKNDQDTIHVFSVASGHLYERFLKIMMLSVIENTKSPVKFWFLKNYLSPQFKDFVPFMAEKYNFEYELITYKWPSWLNHQTEKQRIIWGYKILFLDVLFPLNVNKIIYVDADQVVRADLKELVDMDLDGAPYAYTPFCRGKHMRNETKGFRFWDSGFWETHLAGKPYHISALYVVDLAKFRSSRSGDILRSTYHGLSQDKNSLANLDQDLPNYLQDRVRIFSLPQEWLYCETWCDNEIKEKAKTIDLCNNPLTKSPKLDNAVRIVSEWPRLDETARALTSEQKSVAAAATIDGGDGDGVVVIELDDEVEVDALEVDAVEEGQDEL